MNLTCVDVTGQATLHVPFELRYTGSASPKQFTKPRRAPPEFSLNIYPPAYLFIWAHQAHHIYPDTTLLSALEPARHTDSRNTYSNGCLKPLSG